MGIFANFTWRPWGKPLSGGRFGFATSGTRSKFNVTPETAMQITAVLCGARVIAEGFAQPPLNVFEETDDERGRTVRKIARDHHLHKLLNRKPNGWMTSFEWRELMALHAVIASDGYSFINRFTRGDRKDEVAELLPMAPDEVEPVLGENFELQYKWHVPGQEPVTLKRDQVFHLRGPSWDGYTGLDILRLAREAIGLSGAIERSQADHFGKGARPSGVLSTENTVPKATVEKIRTHWVERFGVNGEGGTAILDNGWKWNLAQMAAVDSQLIESRAFQIEEIGRALRVFPLMMMAADKVANFASASEFFTAHVVHSLGPWYERGEQAIKRDIIGDDGGNEHLYARFKVDGLMRGNPKERADFNRSMSDGGIFTRNEVRVDEGKNPIDGLDDPLTPLNMVRGPGDPPEDGDE